ncbi:serine acetyltransferase [Kineococcus terrestris]|uniref:serine acetyltransferase n=1 Tax=Kineococcus terrestris TaxID=2044856 RepID=UPI0034DB27D1
MRGRRSAEPPERFTAWVFQDWRVNRRYPDSQLVLAWFRLAQWAYRRWGFPGLLVAWSYRFFTSLVFSVELPHQLEVGPRLKLFHPHSIVLNPGVRMGADCTLRQSVTIGNSTRRDGSERGVVSVGDHVEFGAGCVVVGDIHIGDHARVAALALVLDSVPDHGVVRGNPAQLVRIDDPAQGR